MKNVLSELIAGKVLSEHEAETMMQDLLHKQISPVQISAFITLITARGISVDELIGFQKALIANADLIEVDYDDLIDVCGTGGDAKDTFNISTLTSLTLAGLGYRIAKHGNVSASGIIGSSNILEYLGLRFTNDREILKRSLEKYNICFLHAPLFHPALKAVASIRKELAVRTFFNLLGPLVNPVQPKFSFTGVSSIVLYRLYSQVNERIARDYAVIYDLAGYDEVSLTATSLLLTNNLEITINPEDFNLNKLSYSDLASGGTLERASRIFLDVLAGKAHTQITVVAANVASVLKAYCPNSMLIDNYHAAYELLKSGSLKKVFTELCEFLKA